jgi:hypothetical protein
MLKEISDFILQNCELLKSDWRAFEKWLIRVVGAEQLYLLLWYIDFKAAPLSSSLSPPNQQP